MCAGKGEDAPPVAGAEVEDRPLVTVDQGGQLTDVDLGQASPGEQSHGRESSG
jgi:hypothetical protein